MTKKEALYNQLKKENVSRDISVKNPFTWWILSKTKVAVAALAIVFGQYLYEYNFITINFFSLIVLCI